MSAWARSFIFTERPFFSCCKLIFSKCLRTDELTSSKSDLPLTYERLKYHPSNAQIDDG